MSRRSTTLPDLGNSTVGNVRRRAAEEAARRITETWEREGLCNLPSALAEHPYVLQDRSLFFDLVQQEYQSSQSNWKGKPISAYCDRFTGLPPDLHASLYRLIEVEQYLDAYSDLGLAEAEIQWPAPGGDFAEFEIVEELGRGAVGRVYRCHQIPLAGREVVVKVSQSSAVEASNLGRLRHPNVVPIHSAGVDSKTGLGWFCMPFVGRRTLADTIAGDAGGSGKPALQLGFEETLRLFVDLAGALAYIHSRGLLHGDLKPSNVLVSEAGTPMLIDFNLSVNSSLDGNPVGGTLRYMAPERLRSLQRSGRFDIGRTTIETEVFAFAVMLAEVLLGKYPFEYGCGGMRLEDVAQSLLKSYAGRATGLILHLEKTDIDVARLLRRCLSDDPSQRPSGFTEIQGSLRRSARILPRLRRLSRARPLTLASVTVLLAASAFAVVRHSGANAEEAILAARAAIEAGDTPRGIRMLERIVSVGGSGATTRRLLGEGYLAESDYESAADHFMEAWRGDKSAEDVAMAAYCMNLGGSHALAKRLWEQALDLEPRSIEYQSNHAASLLSLLRKSYDDDKSRVVERRLLGCYEADRENETVRLHMLRHFLLAAEDQSRRLPEYPLAIAAEPGSGASEVFFVLATRFLAHRSPPERELAQLGLPLLERIAALHGVSALQERIGRDAMSVFESVGVLRRVTGTAAKPTASPPPAFLFPGK